MSYFKHCFYCLAVCLLLISCGSKATEESPSGTPIKQTHLVKDQPLRRVHIKDPMDHLEHLLQFGCPISRFDSLMPIATPRMQAFMLRRLIGYPDSLALPRMEKLLNQGLHPDSLMGLPREKGSVLGYVLAGKQWAKMDLLLQHGADPMFFPFESTENGTPFIQEAVISGDTELVSKLLNHTTNPFKVFPGGCPCCCWTDGDILTYALASENSAYWQEKQPDRVTPPAGTPGYREYKVMVDFILAMKPDLRRVYRYSSIGDEIGFSLLSSVPLTESRALNLIALGAPVNPDSGSSPVREKALSGDLEWLQFYLDQGGKVDKQLLEDVARGENWFMGGCGFEHTPARIIEILGLLYVHGGKPVAPGKAAPEDKKWMMFFTQVWHATRGFWKWEDVVIPEVQMQVLNRVRVSSTGASIRSHPSESAPVIGKLKPSEELEAGLEDFVEHRYTNEEEVVGPEWKRLGLDNLFYGIPFKGGYGWVNERDVKIVDELRCGWED